MEAPPGLARAMERGIAPFRGKQAAHLLPTARLGGPMLWVIAIMVALTLLAAGMGLAGANLGAAARSDLDGGGTIQILEPDTELRSRQSERAIEALEQLPGVEELRLVPEAELAQLIEPWLGESVEGDTVPIPALIDVRLGHAAGAAELQKLREVLAQAAPDARVDAQAEWLQPVFSAIGTLRWLAIALIMLLGFTSAAAVWLSARNALNANRDTIEIVHLLGGTDIQIARIFQRSILIDAAVGALIGFVFGAIMLAIMGAQFSALESGMVAGGGLSWGDWFLLTLVPVGGVIIALGTARLTVMRSLGKLL